MKSLMREVLRIAIKSEKNNDREFCDIGHESFKVIGLNVLWGYGVWGWELVTRLGKVASSLRTYNTKAWIHR